MRPGERHPLKEQQAPCRRALDGPMSVWLPPRARRSLAPGVRRENEGQESERPRSRGVAAVTERTAAQPALRRHNARVPAPFVSPAKAAAQEPRWCRCHGTDLSAAGVPPARCLGALEKTAPSRSEERRVGI